MYIPIHIYFHMLVTLMKITGHGAAETRQRNDEQAREQVHAARDVNSAVQQYPKSLNEGVYIYIY